MKIINVIASSLDGKIGKDPFEPDITRRKYGFANESDHEFVRQQIKTADAIITGANSVRAEGIIWNQKGKNDKYPCWYVYTNKGLSKDLKFWQQTSIPRVLVSQQTLPSPFPDPAVKNLCYYNQSPAQTVYQDMLRQNFETVLLFGGSQINSLFYNAGLVNQLKLTLCPLLLDGEQSCSIVSQHLHKLVKFRLLSSHVVESYVFLHYDVCTSKDQPWDLESEPMSNP